jgi:hypothetical protein
MRSSAQERLLGAAVEEALRDPGFHWPLRRALEEAVPKRQRRRAPPAIDRFAAYERGGEVALRGMLVSPDLDQLKDVVAHHQMDRARLGRKWQRRERLVDLIVAQTTSRAHKGEAFLR